VLSRPTKWERAQQRSQLGKLSERVVAPTTLKRYSLALAFFFDTLRAHGMLLVNNAAEFDQQVCEVIDIAWQEGESRGLIGDLLSGLVAKVGALRHRLHGAWRLFGAWGRLELPARAWPLSLDQVLAMAWVAWSWRLPGICAGLLIGFDCFLRTGEICSLQTSQLSHNRGQLYIALPDTKGSARKGAPEGAKLTSDVLALFVWRLCGRSPAGAKVIGCTAAEFRVAFAEIIGELGLQGHFLPYSLRRGGATEFFMRHGQLDVAAERGRWASARTARIYINTALADRTEQQQPGSVHVKVKHFAFAMRTLLLSSSSRLKRVEEPGA